MKSSHTFAPESAVFDEDNIVSSAGLVPVMQLAEQAGLSELIGEHVAIDSARVRSGAVNPVGKLTALIGGMLAGAQCIDDVNILRAGGTSTLFEQVYAPSTIGTFLREFTYGHSNQLAAVLRRHLIALSERAPLLPGIAERAFLDIDSLLRPVYGHRKEGASFGHAKIAGRQLLRRGLSPQVVTLSTAQAALVVCEMRLRAGRAGSGRGAASLVRSAIPTARECGASGTIMLRSDSAFGTMSVVHTALAAGIEFSLAMTRNRRITAAIAAIDEDSWIPVHYPGAVLDPDTGALISDAEVAETGYSAFSGRHRVTARLVVRRVTGANHPDALVPVWRYHPFFTNSDLPTVEADITHRRHAIVFGGVRRPDRRPARPHPVRAFRRELCVGVVRGDHPQSAAGGRHRLWRGPRRRPRRHRAPQDRRRSRQIRQTRPKTRPAPALPLALDASVEHPVAEHHHRRGGADTRCLTPTTPPNRPDQEPSPTWMSWHPGQRITPATNRNQPRHTTLRRRHHAPRPLSTDSG